MRAIVHTGEAEKLFPRLMRAWHRRHCWRHPFAGLKWFVRASDGNIVVLSRHWPHLMCWSWAINWMLTSRRADDRRVRWRPIHIAKNTGGDLIIGPLLISWQNTLLPERSKNDEALAFVNARVR